MIVTIAIEGSASIIISDDTAARLSSLTAAKLHSQTGEASVDAHRHESNRRFHFRLSPGQAYALADDARNKCVHGVLADAGCERRESLNLRFGLHSKGRFGQPATSEAGDGSADVTVTAKAVGVPVLMPVQHGDAEAVAASRFWEWDEVLRHWQPEMGER